MQADPPRPARALRNASVRTKLLLVGLAPFLTVLPILFFLIFYWGLAYYDRLLTFKVSSDLAVAHEYFKHVQERTGSDITRLGDAHALVMTIEEGDMQSLQQLLQRKQAELNLDFLFFLDTQGTVQVSSYPGEGSMLPDHAFWPVVTSALHGKAQTDIDLYSSIQLKAIDHILGQRAKIELVKTENAEPTTKTAIESGMVIHSATPVYNTDGRLLGVLEGGVLLNRNLGFVDTINNLVYAQGLLPAGSNGTATLFIDDVRIATNVRLFSELRALGTRASQTVRHHVMDEGRTWLDRAFVVHDWYISAYEPIIDSFGERVGMLYVGYLEAPFRTARQAVILLLTVLFGSICIAGVYFSLRVARGIYRPLGNMSRTMTAVQQGDLHARTGSVEIGDEIGKLSLHLDKLLDTIEAQNVELKAWGEQLDRKVMERTTELEKANTLLRQTQRQLVLAEKLASIGEITAGVAHEINNPVTVLQGNLDILRDMLGEHAHGVASELQLMDQQIYRINTIVSKLLQFANPEDFAGYVETVQTDNVVADSLVLVRHLLNQNGIAVVHDKGASIPVSINVGELQQVLVNLFTNAIHAMKNGGTLTIITHDWHEENQNGIIITVRDTGVGIQKENQAHIFDAFFTTKHQRGTGLGLSISYTLIARYGGTITVTSEPGKGTEFTVRLPAS